MSDTVVSFERPVSTAKTSDNSTLHGDLVANIRELIIEGDLEPGAKVPERIPTATLHERVLQLRRHIRYGTWYLEVRVLRNRAKPSTCWNMSADGAELCAYEKQRLENIARNRRVLEALGLVHIYRAPHLSGPR